MNCSAQSTSPATLKEESNCTENASVQLRKSSESFKSGWLAPYIEQDMTKTLRSTEKVELWLKAHFSSQPSGQQASGYRQEYEEQGLQYGERTPASESVLTSLAAMVLSTLQDTESSGKLK